MDEPFDDEQADINPIKLNTRIDNNSLLGQTATISTWQNVTQVKDFDPRTYAYDLSDRHFTSYEFQQSTMSIAYKQWFNTEQLLRLSSNKGNELVAHIGDSGGKFFDVIMFVATVISTSMRSPDYCDLLLITITLRHYCHSLFWYRCCYSQYGV